MKIHINLIFVSVLVPVFGMVSETVGGQEK